MGAVRSKPTLAPGNGFLDTGSGFPNGHTERLLQGFHQTLVRLVDLGIGEGAFRVTVDKRVSQAFLSGRDVFSAEDIEEIDLF